MSSVHEAQPDQDEELQKFHNWVKGHLVTSKEPSNKGDRDFVTSDGLKDYFLKDGSKRLRRLLDIVAPSTSGETTSIEDVTNNHLIVFAILLSIGKGRFVGHFSKREGLSDAKLPFTDKTQFPTDTEDTLFERFKAKQWIFCAARFESRPEAFWEPDRILPIIFKTPMKSGGGGETFKIKIHPSYDFLGGRQQSSAAKVSVEGSQTRRDQLNQENASYPYYVLKTYKPDSSQYRNEINAFKKLRPGNKLPHLIGFHNSYEYNDTFNTILEYANGGTLEDYFQREAAPVERESIFAFWNSLMETAKALCSIHNIKDDQEAKAKALQGSVFNDAYQLSQLY